MYHINSMQVLIVLIVITHSDRSLGVYEISESDHNPVLLVLSAVVSDLIPVVPDDVIIQLTFANFRFLNQQKSMK